MHVNYIGNSKELYGQNGLCRSTVNSAGMDLRACLKTDYADIMMGDRLAINTGIRIEIQSPQCAGFVFSRSGLGAVKGLCVAQGVGLIDPDYRGEIIVYVLNTSKETLRVQNGDRIAQLVIMPFMPVTPIAVETLSETSRGTGGFGHTGKE